MRIGEEPRPPVIGRKSLVAALVIHVALIGAFYIHALPLPVKETVIPIDLTVVVRENLDGNPDEPPPLEKPPPTPPPPKPQPKPEPDPIPEAKERLDAVEKVPEKKKPEAKKPEKKPEPKKAEKNPVEERLRMMRESAKDVKDPKPAKPQPNGRTEKKTLTDKQIRDLLNQGYKPGATTQLASSEEQRCASLIRAAFYAKWDRPAWTSSLGIAHLLVRFGPGGQVLSYRLTNSFGDGAADATVLGAASRVGAVHGLSTDFLRNNSEVTVQFEVKPR